MRLAQSIAHQPSVLILDEPLNGLDPMVRAETIALFRKLAAEGLHLIISSHILHEVDMMSDRVVLLNNGYVVAEGGIHGVRDEMETHPMQILIRCDRPGVLAARMFAENDVVEARLHEDRGGLFVKTREPDRFYLLLNAKSCTRRPGPAIRRAVGRGSPPAPPSDEVVRRHGTDSAPWAFAARWSGDRLRRGPSPHSPFSGTSALFLVGDATSGEARSRITSGRAGARAAVRSWRGTTLASRRIRRQRQRTRSRISGPKSSVLARGATRATRRVAKADL